MVSIIVKGKRTFEAVDVFENTNVINISQYINLFHHFCFLVFRIVSTSALKRQLLFCLDCNIRSLKIQYNSCSTIAPNYIRYHTRISRQTKCPAFPVRRVRSVFNSLFNIPGKKIVLGEVGKGITFSFSMGKKWISTATIL